LLSLDTELWSAGLPALPDPLLELQGQDHIHARREEWPGTDLLDDLKATVCKVTEDLKPALKRAAP